MQEQVVPRRYGDRVIWEVQQAGRFIIGDACESLAIANLDALRRAQWKFLDCARLGYHPLTWLRHVRDSGGTVRFCIRQDQGGRALLEGVALPDCIGFRFLILDAGLLEAIRRELGVPRKACAPALREEADRASTPVPPPPAPPAPPTARASPKRPPPPDALQLSLL